MELILAVSGGALLIAVIVFGFIKSRSDQTDIDAMSGEEFEEYAAALLSANGYEIDEMTARSNDYGADIIASRGGARIAVQCKRYAKNVGIAAVQEAIAAKSHYQCEKCAVLTNAHFTRQAVTLAEENGVMLWDRETLFELAAARGKNESFQPDRTAAIRLVKAVGERSDDSVFVVVDKTNIYALTPKNPLTLTVEADVRHKLLLLCGARKRRLTLELCSGECVYYAAGYYRNKPVLIETARF